MENKWISNFHGMELEPIAEDNKRSNENGILFLCEYYFLKQILGTITNEDIKIFQEITVNLRTYGADGVQIRGLFDRGAKESITIPKELMRTISHDNLTGISSFSKNFENMGLAYHEEIASFGKNNFWRFDNIYPEKPRWERIQHPRDIVFWSYLANSFLAKLFVIIPVISCLVSCFIKEETSGKLLTFVRLYPIRKKWWVKLVWKLCTRFVNKNFEKGWLSVFNIYFKNPEHPINLLAKEAYEKKKELF